MTRKQWSDIQRQFGRLEGMLLLGVSDDDIADIISAELANLSKMLETAYIPSE